MSVREFPIHYIEPVFRPPSEAHSLILPVTNGCSWNKCGFCEMYTQPQKKFRARDENEVLEEIRRCGERLIVKRVFLADGDALVLPTRRLLAVLQAIRQHLPEVERVSSYCLPRNLRRKSVDELRELADAGLRMAYVGAESGDDEVLARVNKGETYSSTLDALEKLGEAGISRSVMILNGLGGMTLSAQHADNSARLMNAAQPEYLSTLVVSSLPASSVSVLASPISRRWTGVPCSSRSNACCRVWSSKTRYFAATTLPTIWCSRANWVPTRRACWPRSARLSSSRSTLPCARSGSVACDGAEAASARHSPVFRRRQGR